MKTNLFYFLLIPFITWSQTQIGVDIDGEAAGDQSGKSVSLSSDGSIVAIGGYNNLGTGSFSGHVRVFRNVDGNWSQLGGDIDGEAAQDRSGNSVSLSSNGDIVAVGAVFNDGNGSGSGQVRVYQNVEDNWVQIGEDVDGEAALDQSGFSVSLSSNGSIVAIGAHSNDGSGPGAGHVRVYQNVENNWVQIGEDIDGEAAEDLSGTSVSLSSDGSIVAIGAHSNDGNGSGAGHTRIYKNIQGSWLQIGDDIDGEAISDQSGYSVSLSSDGSIVAIGAIFNDGNGSSSGHVRVYQNLLGVWIQIGDDIEGESAGDQSSSSIALSSDGSIIAIGAVFNDGNGSGSGHVRIYRNIGGIWSQIIEDIDGEAAGDQSGNSVALSSDGSVVAIGGYANDGNGADSGHVRVYNVSHTLSTKEIRQNSFSVYPNPARNNIEINLGLDKEFKQLNIYTALGRYLYSEKKLAIDISNLSSGMYILEVETDQGKWSKKIMKK